jgi:type I restriction enzyme S subunit
VAPDETRVIRDFITNILGIHHVRGQIEREFSTESGMMKNVSKPVLLGLTFPLPPIPEQQKMVQALGDARTKASGMRADAAALRAQAWVDFEAAVYAAEDADDAADLIAAAS